MVMSVPPPSEHLFETSDRPIGRSIFKESEHMIWDWQQDGLLTSGVHEVADIWTYQNGFERKNMQSHQIVLAANLGFEQELTWQYTISDETGQSIINIAVTRDGQMSSWRADYTQESNETKLTAVWDTKKPKQIKRLWAAMKDILTSGPAAEQRASIQNQKQAMRTELEALKIHQIGLFGLQSQETVGADEKARLSQVIQDVRNSLNYAGFKKARLAKKPKAVKDEADPTPTANPLAEAREKLLDSLFLKYIPLKSLLDLEAVINPDRTEVSDAEPLWQYERYGDKKRLTAMGQMPLFIDWHRENKEKEEGGSTYQAVEYVSWNDPKPTDKSVIGLQKMLREGKELLRFKRIGRNGLRLLRNGPAYF